MANDNEAVGRRGFLKGAAMSAASFVGDPHGASHAGHDHGHDHDHQEHDHQTVPADIALRVKAIESLLVDKGVVDRAALDAIVDAFETKIGPRNGARVVARAWVDPAYRKRLLANATTAIAELGFSKHQDEDMVVLENTPKVHNLVVCTLCSCYPWPVLGLPPVWYKSAPYRSRAVIDPRGVLREFGLDLSPAVEVRVWDSTAEIRYLVLPERPAGSEHMTEEQQGGLVTRDSWIGPAKSGRGPGATVETASRKWAECRIWDGSLTRRRSRRSIMRGRGG